MPPPKRGPLWVQKAVPSARTPPAWVQPFLAALGSCGNVTRAAALAGVDVTGPYNRRARYPEFREAWERVVAEREARAAGGQQLEIHALTPLACGESPSPAPAGEGLEGVGATGVRLGRGAVSRWSRGAEERFLEELTASANVARAAAAAGFSAAAIYKRKLRDKHFACGWDAAIAVGRSRLEAHLIHAAERSFDPEGLPVAEGTPKVSVSEAISILKHWPSGAATGSSDFPTWQEEGDAMSNDEVTALREKIIAKLGRVRERDNRRKIEDGWTQDGENWIPPGWVRG